jgi:predicted alpha/beta hydrolase family esterase
MGSIGFAAGRRQPTLLIMPGLDGSGPDHWQSHWEHLLPDCRRIVVRDWSSPDREHWVDRLDRAIGSTVGPAIIVAHSLGCLTVAWWAKQRWNPALATKLIGALLVAPPCVENECRTPRLFGFRPTPRGSLPFPSLLVASRDDPYCSLGNARRLARRWGSRFVDAGAVGHINANSGVGAWEDGIALLGRLIASTTSQHSGQDDGFPTLPGRVCAEPLTDRAMPSGL